MKVVAPQYGHVRPKGSTPIARIRIQAARLKKDELWKEIAYGPKRWVTCACGGQVEDIPQTGEYDGGACSHIMALYSGEVTEDRREAGSAPLVGGPSTPRPPWLIQLTQYGRQLFEWRWAVKKLSES